MTFTNYRNFEFFCNQFFKYDFLKISFFDISTSKGCILASFEDRGLSDGLLFQKLYLVYASTHNSMPTKCTFISKSSHFFNLIHLRPYSFEDLRLSLRFYCDFFQINPYFSGNFRFPTCS